MKTNSNNLTTYIVSGIAILIFVVFGYFYLVGTSNTASPLTRTSVLNPTTIKSRSIFYSLSSLRFDTGIFSDARFNALQDMSVPITPEPTGRKNPFAPI